MNQHHPTHRPFPFLRSLGLAGALGLAAVGVPMGASADEPASAAENAVREQGRRPGDRADRRAPSQGHRRARKARRLSRALGLTDAQKTALRGIVREARRARHEILRTMEPGTEDRRDALRALRAERRAEMMAILTPAQVEELVAIRAARRARGHGRGGPQGR